FLRFFSERPLFNRMVMVYNAGRKECDVMQSYVKFLDGLPLILKIVLALPGLDAIVYGIYRIAKGNLLIGLLWIFILFPIGWIIDIITLILNGKVTFLV
ncbi:MAG TPA: hypothetical protein P5154_04280, partial [Candidatus Izemoplasmatales bacterium]|nr:hypothetical protein [Candidatus Izemoplasmatales bacterium]